MGHTLVTRFDEAGYERFRWIVGAFPANKIPYGRDCDREAANRILKHHVTVFHWGKARDGYYLKRLEDFRFQPCRLAVTGAAVMPGEENSLLLYLKVKPAEGFPEMVTGLEKVRQAPTTDFLHITLAVSKDHGEILALNRRMQETVKFPFLINVTGLDLYHIWKPTSYVRCYQ